MKMNDTRKCVKCNVDKPPSAFYDKRGHKMVICKLCINERKKRNTTPRYGCELDQIHAGNMPPVKRLSKTEIEQLQQQYQPPTGRVSPAYRTIERWLDRA